MIFSWDCAILIAGDDGMTPGRARCGAGGALLALVVLWLPNNPATAATWTLVGGARNPQIVQALHDARVLVCETDRCDVFDPHAGTWGATAPPLIRSTSIASVLLRGGDVLVVAASASTGIETQIWSPRSGRWTAGARLLDAVDLPQLRLLPDGRVLMGARANDQVWLYIAPLAFVGSWTRVTGYRVPGLMDYRITDAGALVVARDNKTWRYDIGRGDWREFSFAFEEPMPADAMFSWWGNARLLLGKRNGNWRGMLNHSDGRTTSTVSFAAPTRLRIGGVQSATVPNTAESLLLIDESANVARIWTDPDQPPRVLPPNPFGLPFELKAIDGHRFFGVNGQGFIGPGASLQILSLDDQPIGGEACDGLTNMIKRVFADAPPPPLMTPYVDEALFYENWDQGEAHADDAGFVSLACRAALRNGRAPALSGLLRNWTHGSDTARIRTGRLWACATQDPQSLSDVPHWMTDLRWPSVRKVCATQLSTWPGAERERNTASTHYVRKGRDGWEIDYAVVVAADRQGAALELREQLVPVLREGARRQARGFDRLRKGVCKESISASTARKQACAEAETRGEGHWLSARERGRAWMWTGISSAIVVGAVAGTYATRESGTGRGIATTSGVIGGATLGIALTGLAMYRSSSVGGKGDGVGALILLGMVGGGIGGGLLGHHLAASPSSRAGVTAGSLVLPYVISLAIAFD